MASARTVLALTFASAVAVSAAGQDLRLIDAVKAGDRPGALALLRQRIDVNVREADGTTALHWAVRADELELVSALLRSRAAVDPANRYGVTPLFLAAANGNLAIVEMLAAAGANPNATMPDGQTVVMAAARSGHPAVVQAVLARGADANARESRLGETALMWAAAENHAGAIKALVQHGADVNARSAKADFPRFSFGDGIVALMMTLPRGDWTATMYASRQGARDAVRALAEAQADLDLVDPEGTTALMLAINNAHYGVAAELIEQGADANVADATGMTALYAAVNMNTLGDLPGRPAPKPTGTLTAVDVTRMLLARGANPNARLLKPILMRHHSAGDAALGEGATPLLRAAKTGDIEMMRLLLGAGADASLTTRNQTTALMFAAGPTGGGLGGNYEVPDTNKITAIDLCLEHGVDINAIDVNGQTALHLAAGQPGAAIVAALVQRGSTLDLKDKQGRTPLDVALGVGGRGGQPVVRKENVEVLQGAARAEPRPSQH
jgi:ankyrin repeat protein